MNLARSLGCEAPSKLSKVSDLSDAVFTVVTDDTAMRQNLLWRRKSFFCARRAGTFVYQLRDD